jgi:hypothetical protein
MQKFENIIGQKFDKREKIGYNREVGGGGGVGAPLITFGYKRGILYSFWL